MEKKSERWNCEINSNEINYLIKITERAEQRRRVTRFALIIYLWMFFFASFLHSSLTLKIKVNKLFGILTVSILFSFSPFLHIIMAITNGTHKVWNTMHSCKSQIIWLDGSLNGCEREKLANTIDFESQLLFLHATHNNSIAQHDMFTYVEASVIAKIYVFKSQNLLSQLSDNKCQSSRFPSYYVFNSPTRTASNFTNFRSDTFCRAWAR